MGGFTVIMCLKLHEFSDTTSISFAEEEKKKPQVTFSPPSPHIARLCLSCAPDPRHHVDIIKFVGSHHALRGCGLKCNWLTLLHRLFLFHLAQSVGAVAVYARADGSRVNG